MSRVEIASLSFTYPGAPGPALRDVDLVIEPGELVVLAGASGSGKSTLLRALAGLVPHFSGGTLSGRVTVAGRDTRDAGPGELAAHVGSLFADPETQVVMATPRAELSFPLENRGWTAAEVARGVEETALALVVDALLDRPVGELSGGELQRVALGATLAPRPSILCLDEPTSQLDPVAGDELIGLLRRLNEDAEVTVLLAEHRLERCLPMADRVVAMDDGRVAFDGCPEEFLAWAALHAPALATPGARLLAGLGLPPVPGVKRARATLRAAGRLPGAGDVIALTGQKSRQRRPSAGAATLRFDRAWHEIRNGPAILRGVSLQAQPGERIALMGRNGAGKSTLLRHAAGLMTATRGSVRAQGRVALLLQNPTDYLVHDTVAGEGVPLDTLRALGLARFAGRHPRDLSSGERQRLALAIVLGDLADPPAVLCLDEPTRGMDRHHREQLLALLAAVPDTTILLATHDPEFASAFAERVLLMADGRIIADGTPQEILCGGTYFATETARILGGAAGALVPADGIQLLSRAQEVLA